jgi:hypothetical protein
LAMSFEEISKILLDERPGAVRHLPRADGLARPYDIPESLVYGLSSIHCRASAAHRNPLFLVIVVSSWFFVFSAVGLKK